jgi:hypothetical protein
MCQRSPSLHFLAAVLLSAMVSSFICSSWLAHQRRAALYQLRPYVPEKVAPRHSPPRREGHPGRPARPAASALPARPAPPARPGVARPCPGLRPELRVQANFEAAPLLSVIEWMSAYSCQRFLIPSDLTDIRITVISPRPAPVQDAQRAFLAALEASGLRLVEQGDFLRIEAR